MVTTASKGKPQANCPYLLWATMAVVMASFHVLLTDHAHASDLPPNVSGGYLFSKDDVVVAGGTSLNVPSMLADASGAGNSTAVFSAVGLKFSGTLSVDCPATAALWSDDVALVVLIEMGFTDTAAIPSIHIQVTGALSRGSSITVSGGSYAFSDVFLHLPSAFYLLDGSSLLVRGATIRAIPTIATPSSLLRAISTITVSDSSTLSIANNSLTTSDVSISGWSWYLVNAARIAVSRMGKLSVDFNNVSITNFTLSGSTNTWKWYLLSTGTNPMDITDKSTVSVTENSVTVSGTSVAQDWTSYGIFVDDDNPISVGNNSHLNVERNVLKVTGSIVKRRCVHYWLLLDGPLTMTDKSGLSVKNNVIAASDMAVTSTVSWTVAATQNPTIRDSSTATISRNALTLSNSLVLGWGWIFFTTGGSLFSLFNHSSLSVDNNSAAGSNITGAGSYNWLFLAAPIDATNNSAVSTSYNNATVSDSSLGTVILTLVISEPIVATASSRLSIIGNAIAIVGATLSQNVAITVLDSTNQITISDNSRVHIEFNTRNVLDVTLGRYFNIYILDMLYKGVTISDGSAVAIANNMDIFTNVNVKNTWQMYSVKTDDQISAFDASSFSVIRNLLTVSNVSAVALIFYFVKGTIAVGNHSSISIADNVYEMAGFSFSGGSWCWLRMSTSTISPHGTLRIEGNIANVVDVAVAGSWWFWGIYLYYQDLSISNTGAISISDNTITVANTTIGQDWKLILFEDFSRMSAPYLTPFEVFGSLSINNNMLLADTVTTVVGGLWALNVVKIQEKALIVYHGGSISVNHNEVSFSSADTSLFLSDTTVTVNGTVSLSYNVISSTIPSSLLYQLLPAAGIMGNGTFNLIRNTIANEGTMINVTAMSPTVYTCRNAVNGGLCVNDDTVGYTCVAARSNLLHDVSECSPTTTWTLSPSISTGTNTTTLVVPPTVTPTKSLVPTATDNTTCSKSPNTSPSITTTHTEQPPPTTTSTTTTMANLTTTATPATTSIATTATVPASNTPLCDYTCEDVIAVMVVDESSPSIPPQQVADDYWARYLSGPRHSTDGGCAYTGVPFTATASGSMVRLVVHLNATLNTTYPMRGNVFVNGAFEATAMLAQYAHGGVMVYDVHRIDSNPLTSVVTTLLPPQGALQCSADSSRQDGGLPSANIVLGAPPTVLPAPERVAVAVVSASAADMQTLAAVSLLQCSPGNNDDVETEAGIRALVLVALSGTCVGAVQGALIALGAVGLLSALVMCIVKHVRGVTWLQAAATARCPGMVFGVWAFLQMGLVVCGARLVVVNGSEDIALGVVGVVAGGVLPAVCVGLTWAFVSRRCYRLAHTPIALTSTTSAVLWARSIFLPSYQLDADVYPISKAFSTLVGRTRRPSPLWAGLWTLQPVIMLVAALVGGGFCSAIMILSAVALLFAALCHATLRPHRIVASNYLQAAAMAINGGILITSSQLASTPTNSHALDAFYALTILQIVLSVCRGVLSLTSVVYMHFYGKETLTNCEPDGSRQPSSPSDVATPAFVFDIGGHLSPTPTPTPPLLDHLMTSVTAKPPSTSGGKDQVPSNLSDCISSSSSENEDLHHAKTNKQFKPEVDDFVAVERPVTLEEHTDDSTTTDDDSTPTADKEENAQEEHEQDGDGKSTNNSPEEKEEDRSDGTSDLFDDDDFDDEDL